MCLCAPAHTLVRDPARQCSFQMEIATTTHTHVLCLCLCLYASFRSLFSRALRRSAGMAEPASTAVAAPARKTAGGVGWVRSGRGAGRGPAWEGCWRGCWGEDNHVGRDPPIGLRLSGPRVLKLADNILITFASRWQLCLEDKSCVSGTRKTFFFKMRAPWEG